MKDLDFKDINFEKLITQALKNINSDREETKDLLNDLTTYISGGSDRHKDCGFTLAKYLETLQRSNEQLVKLISILKKKDSNEDIELSKEEKESIFEQLNSVNKSKPNNIKNKK